MRPLNASCATALVVLIAAAGRAQQEPNLALKAVATASETYQDLTPAKAIDGDANTRWSCIPGHNSGVWFELDWDKPVRVAELRVLQYDRFVMEMDVQAWDGVASKWSTLAHLGKPDERLARVVLVRFPTVETSKLRLANITNGPSFCEVAAFEHPYRQRLTTVLASDLRGNAIGIMTDADGIAPIAGAEITVSGKSGTCVSSVHTGSDANGMFTAPIPLGLRGPVHIHTVLRDGGAVVQEADTAVPATSLQIGLTPQSAGPKAVDLTGAWRFCPSPPRNFVRIGFDDRQWPEIRVPAHWEMEGFQARDGVGGYRRHFAAPPGDGRVKLRFEGVYSGAEVWVNGQLVAQHEGGFTPFEADITGSVTSGDNVLAVRVREHTDVSDKLDHMSQYADFPLAGIIRPVYLFRVPAIHVGRLEVEPRFDKQYRDATLHVSLAIHNEGDAMLRGAARAVLTGPDGKVVAASKPQLISSGPWYAPEAVIDLPVREPRKWDAEHPNLYRLTVELLSHSRVVQRVTQKVGFHQTDIRGTQILVNGTPVKFKGTCHHDQHPLMGRAVNRAVTLMDLRLMKEANLNAVRTSHYPPTPDLPEIADELGLYVEDEADFCWVGQSDDLRLTPRILQLTAELIARDRNHPSVFMWSLCNESGFGYGFERSHEWVRATEPSRPTGAATSAWLEIATLHNPISVKRIDENESLDKPLLFDESFGPFQGIFNDVAEMWVDPGMRDYYSAPLLAVYDRFLGSKVTQGSFIWCWADDIFCVPNRGLEYGRGATRSHFIEGQYRQPGKGLVGDAPWGVVDGWRRKKPEFFIVQKLHEPIVLPEKPLPMPKPGEPVRIPVENRYDFTNLNEFTIEPGYMVWNQYFRPSLPPSPPAPADRPAAVRVNVPPHGHGFITLPSSAIPPSGPLTLCFLDAHGRLVREHHVRFATEAQLAAGQRPARFAAPAPGEGAATPPLDVRQESWLAGESTVIEGDRFAVSFDKESGLLRRGTVGDMPALLEYPMLHVLPTASPLSPLPDRTTWRCKSVASRREGPNVVVAIEGTYGRFEGGYEMTITPQGDLTTRARFTYTGPDVLAREMGLRFSVPRGNATLVWKRQAEWADYPGDHIGRPLGIAVAFPRPKPVRQRPWSEDPSPMGSNDFRSTKRGIRWAAIDSDGAQVKVLSDGSQNLRAFVDTDRISVHVNDWYGGTNVGWWEWVSNYGKGKLLRTGDRVESVVHLDLSSRPLAEEEMR